MIRYDFESLLHGAIDMHVHAYPDMSLDNGGFVHSMQQVMDEYRRAQMGGIVLKTHGWPAPALAKYLDDQFDDIRVIGSVSLNITAGGPYPWAVEMADAVGAKVIFLPTWNSVNEIAHPGMMALVRKGKWLPRLDDLTPGEYYDLVDENGEVLENIKQVVQLCKEKDLVLCTGHNAPEASWAVAKFAKSIGFKKLCLTHAGSGCSYNTLEQMKAFSELGYYVEICTVSLDPMFLEITIPQLKKVIETVGAEHFFLSSDWYMGWRRSAPEDLLKVISCLYFEGLPFEDIRTFMKTPNRILEM